MINNKPLKINYRAICNLDINKSFNERIKETTNMEYREFINVTRNKEKEKYIEFIPYTECKHSCNHCFMVEDDKRVLCDNDADSIMEIFNNIDYKHYDTMLYPSDIATVDDYIKILEKHPQYEIETNADVIVERPEVLEQLKKVGVKKLVTSVHGPKKEHSELCNSDPEKYSKLLDGCRLIKKHGFILEVNSAFHKGSMHALEDTGAILADTGLDTWNVIRIEPYGRAAKWKLDEFITDKVAEEFVIAFSNVRPKYKGQFRVQLDASFGPNFYSRETFRWLAGMRDDLTQTSYCCPALTDDYISISLKTGAVYPCPFLHSFKEHAVGEISENKIVLDQNKKWSQSLIGMSDKLRGICAKDRCEYNEICNGGCRGTALSFATLRGEKEPLFAAVDFCMTEYLERINGGKDIE